MKTHTLIILILFHFFCLTGCGNNQKPNKLKLNNLSIDEIVINYQDLDVETPIRINCEDLESYFNKSIKTRVINDSMVIKKIANYINDSKNNNKSASEIDVRFKMIFTYSDGTIKEFCGNEYAIEVDKSNYQLDINFSSYIKSILK